MDDIPFHSTLGRVWMLILNEYISLPSTGYALFKYPEQLPKVPASLPTSTLACCLPSFLENFSFMWGTMTKRLCRTERKTSIKAG